MSNHSLRRDSRRYALNDVTNGLVGFPTIAWWKFDDGSGSSAADSSGNGLTGTLNNSPTWQAGLGSNPHSLLFNGSNQNVTVPSNALLNFSATQSFTISLWLKTSETGENYPGLINKGATSGATGSYVFFVDGPSDPIPYSLNLQMRDASGNQAAVKSKVGVNDGIVHLATAVVNRVAQTSAMYLDGVLHNTSSVSAVGSLSSTTQLAIAEWQSGPTFFGGALNDIRIYGAALSAAQVASLYAAGPQ